MKSRSGDIAAPFLVEAGAEELDVPSLEVQTARIAAKAWCRTGAKNALHPLGEKNRTDEKKKQEKKGRFVVGDDTVPKELI